MRRLAPWVVIILSAVLAFFLLVQFPGRASAQPEAPGTLVVTKSLSGDALGMQGTVVVRSECNGFTFSPDLIVPAGSTATSSTRTFFGQGAGVSCTVTETVDGAVPGVTVQVIGSPQTVTIPSGGVAVVLISDIFSAAVPPTTTTTTTTVPATTTTTSTLPATTTTSVPGTTTTSTPGETTTTVSGVTTTAPTVATTIPVAPTAPSTPQPVTPLTVTPPTTSTSLALTGSDTRLGLGSAALLIMVGTIIVLVTRRRSS